ncbi:glycosyltransferase family 1 protein [Sulfolobus sp. S-194]|uniref:glycosyltransferase family 4 protein n=1 Tax=Sulfolobus sp. S-194 TaxID=2512240 RepID=UPI0014371C50|nr:glycosyltransferase family 4 protein [Sulfolobus sp. S-194]QIW25164.1 glycosyltransferase family 1 protein [Sulfolobus sp. S-194]
MKLLIVNHRDIFHPQAGGAERVIYEVSRRLVKKGYDVTWLSENVGSFNDELDGIKFLHTGNKYTLHFRSLSYAKKGYDVVIDSIAHAVPFFSYIVNKKSVALVHHVHQDVVKYELNPLLAFIIRQLEKSIRNYPYIISVSNTTKNELIKRFRIDESKITVIYNGIDHEIYKPGEKSSTPTVLWIGRLKNYKNPLDAVKIFKKVRNNKAILYIAGGGDLEENVKRAIAGQKNIIFLGKVNESQKIKLYQQAWVVISTSFIEGWGMTIVEANSCGTPTVAYSSGSIPEIIEDGVNGFLVEYKNIDMFAEKLNYILDDENVMKYLSKRSYESSLKYDWNKTADEYYKYIWKIAES